MMRSCIPRGALLGLLLALTLGLPWPSAARAQDSPPTSRGPTVEFRGFETCAAVEQATLGGERHDWQIEWEEHDLTDNEGSPAPLLSLLAAPDVPSYVAILVQPPALFRRLEDYRAARRAAIERLTEAGLGALLAAPCCLLRPAAPAGCCTPLLAHPVPTKRHAALSTGQLRV